MSAPTLTGNAHSALLTSLVLLCVCVCHGSVIIQANVFVQGQEGYHTYRIPSLLSAQNGTILAFAEGRKYSSSDHGCVHIVVKSSIDGGATWSPVRVVASDPDPNANVTYGNPAPVVHPTTGKISMVFCVNNKNVMYTTSSDNGESWSAPTNITTSVVEPDWHWVATGPPGSVAIPSPQALGGFRLVTPADHIANGNKSYSHVMYSDDSGSTWHLGGTIPLRGSNECQLTVIDDGATLVINMRNPSAYRQFSISKDGGITWSQPIGAKSLPAPVCEGSITSDSSCIYVSNPFGSSKRQNMTVSSSCPPSTTRLQDWEPVVNLYSGQSGYSSLAFIQAGESGNTVLGCLYERGVQSSFDNLTLAIIDTSSQYRVRSLRPMRRVGVPITNEHLHVRQQERIPVVEPVSSKP